MKSFIFIVLFLPLSLWAQPSLQAGFSLMEKGDFKQATTFFQQYLENEDSTHKTALLCFGRAVGLGGNVAKSQQVFEGLLKRYPADYEVTLNFAESFLWEKKPAQALNIYQTLVKTDSNNFVALLGLANTYAALKEYEKATLTIEKALQKDSPNKQNAKVSQKFILLGLADSYVKKREMKKAKPIISNLLQNYSHDKDVLFLAATEALVSEKFALASQHFTQIATTYPQNASAAYLGMSYAAFMLKKNKQALAYSQKALETAQDSNQVFQAYIGKVNALGWNKQFKPAFQLLDSLSSKYPHKWEVKTAIARLRLWNNQAQKGLEMYEQLLGTELVRQEILMGYIETLMANGKEKQAEQEIQKAMAAFPEVWDWRTMTRNLQLQTSLKIHTQAFRSQDNGNNRSDNLRISTFLPSKGKLKPNLSVNVRSLADAGEMKSLVTQVSAGGSYHINSRLEAKANVGIFSARNDYNSFTQPFFDVSVHKKIGKRQNLSLGAKSDMQIYNAALVNRSLKNIDTRLAYNTQSASLIGFYTENIWSRYSDGNQRLLSFSSLYFNLKNEPCLKVGVNGTYLSFQNQVSEQYFSPKKYFSAEVFAQFENIEMPKARFLYQIFVAGGQQKIENFDTQNMYRANAKVGYRWADWGSLSLYYLNSNSLTTNVMGYNYNEFGLNCKMIISNKHK